MGVEQGLFDTVLCMWQVCFTLATFGCGVKNSLQSWLIALCVASVLYLSPVTVQCSNLFIVTDFVQYICRVWPFYFSGMLQLVVVCHLPNTWNFFLLPIFVVLSFLNGNYQVMPTPSLSQQDCHDAAHLWGGSGQIKTIKKCELSPSCVGLVKLAV